MFNDAFKVKIDLASLVAIVESIRENVPPCVIIRLEAIIDDLRGIYNNLAE